MTSDEVAADEAAQEMGDTGGREVHEGVKPKKSSCCAVFARSQSAASRRSRCPRKERALFSCGGTRVHLRQKLALGGIGDASPIVQLAQKRVIALDGPGPSLN
jgi:hypothetical protein